MVSELCCLASKKVRSCESPVQAVAGKTILKVFLGLSLLTGMK